MGLIPLLALLLKNCKYSKNFGLEKNIDKMEG
jgi:hypothetical protein